MNSMHSKSMDFKFNLPVDEDDYLMPSPGPVGQVAYMGIVNEMGVPLNMPNGKCCTFYLLTLFFIGF